MERVLSAPAGALLALVRVVVAPAEPPGVVLPMELVHLDLDLVQLQEEH